MQANNIHNEPMEVLGIDVGSARVGIARANTIAKIPQALAVVPTKTALQNIVSFAHKTQASLVIIGLPLQPDGNEAAQAAMIRDFAQQLKALLPLDQIFIDETYSSIQADEYLKNQPSGAKVNDDIAACIILERYFAEAVHV